MEDKYQKAFDDWSYAGNDPYYRDIRDNAQKIIQELIDFKDKDKEALLEEKKVLGDALDSYQKAYEKLKEENEKLKNNSKNEPKEFFYQGKQLTKNGLFTNPFYKYIVVYDINNADKEIDTNELFDFADYLLQELKKDYQNKQEELVRGFLDGKF